MIGRTISHFRILSKIGEGGMGVVYEAEDLKLGRRVAVKIMPPDLVPPPVQLRRFHREARTAASLGHPHIAVIHEAGEHEGTPFIVMELVQGRTLHEMLKKGPFEFRRWLKIAVPLAQALAHAHKRGIIHRDLKPANVKVTPEGDVKILDFGLAKLLESERETLPPISLRNRPTVPETLDLDITRANKAPGTPAYMSPEQARGDTLDPRSDLFSFGTLLYQMATSRIPFKRDSVMETFHAVITERPDPIAGIAPEFPPEAERLIRKAMEKERDDRYQHADEMVTDLKVLQRDLDSGRVTLTTGAAQALPSPARRRAWPILAGLAALLATASLIFLGTRDGGPRVRPAPPEGAVAVVGFENLEDPEDSEHLGRMLMALITTDLAESGGLNVLSTSRVLTARREISPSGDTTFDPSLASEVARTAGARIMLLGQLGASGERLLLTAELVDVESGSVIGSFSRNVSSGSELFSLAGAIGQGVRRHLVDPVEPVPEGRFDLASALTVSPEAYRSYAAGEIALHERRWSDAIQRFENAVREDPAFALAWYRMAMAHWWQGSQAEVVPALRNGLNEIDRLPERWRTIYRAFLHYHEGQPDPAYEMLSRLAESDPPIPDVYYLLGEVRTHFTRYMDRRAARELFEKALAIDPTYKTVFFHLVDDTIWAGDLEGAATIVRRYREENPADPAIAEAEIAVTMASGRLEEAIDLAERLYGEGHVQVVERLAQAYLMAGEWDRLYDLGEEAIENEVVFTRAMGFGWRGMARIGRGDLRDGLVDVRESVERMNSMEGSRVWLSNLIAIYGILQAQVLEFARDHEGALDAMSEAIQADPLFHTSYYWLARLQLGAGRTAEAEETRLRLEALAGEILAPTSQFTHLLLEAEIALSRDDLQGARTAVTRFSLLPPEHRDMEMELVMRGRVHDAGGEFEEAIEAYEQAMKPVNRYAWARPVVETRLIYRLARLNEIAGRDAEAERRYREFLDRWGEADLPIPEVEEAKSRASARGISG